MRVIITAMHVLRTSALARFSFYTPVVHPFCNDTRSNFETLNALLFGCPSFSTMGFVV
jgi:hypothetical protein